MQTVGGERLLSGSGGPLTELGSPRICPDCVVSLLWCHHRFALYNKTIHHLPCSFSILACQLMIPATNSRATCVTCTLNPWLPTLCVGNKANPLMLDSNSINYTYISNKVAVTSRAFCMKVTIIIGMYKYKYACMILLTIDSATNNMLKFW